MSVRVNVRMSKIMRTPKKVGLRTYTTYANCQTLLLKLGVLAMKKLGMLDNHGM